MLAALQDLIDALLVRGRERLLLVALEELREAEDRVERRPELVAHRREELALGGARRLGGRARVAQLLGAVHVVGQVPDRLDDAPFGRPPVDDAQAPPVARADVERRRWIAAPREALAPKRASRSTSSGKSICRSTRRGAPRTTCRREAPADASPRSRR